MREDDPKICVNGVPLTPQVAYDYDPTYRDTQVVRRADEMHARYHKPTHYKGDPMPDPAPARSLNEYEQFLHFFEKCPDAEKDIWSGLRTNQQEKIVRLWRLYFALPAKHFTTDIALAVLTKKLHYDVKRDAANRYLTMLVQADLLERIEKKAGDGFGFVWSKAFTDVTETDVACQLVSDNHKTVGYGKPTTSKPPAKPLKSEPKNLKSEPIDSKVAPIGGKSGQLWVEDQAQAAPGIPEEEDERLKIVVHIDDNPDYAELIDLIEAYRAFKKTFKRLKMVDFLDHFVRDRYNEGL